jgi:S-adenosylmethionine hydrolase
MVLKKSDKKTMIILERLFGISCNFLFKKIMPAIALLTDFGTKDGYVAAMKAVIFSISPQTAMIDISHEIAPQQIAEGRFVLWTVYRYFPENTIFVCVVDPGVGTDRKILAVETDHHIFLAPDNGLLNMVLTESKIKTAYIVTNKKYFLERISQTFHGRDIFSPVAAHIVNGIRLSGLGDEIDLKIPPFHFINISNKGSYSGEVIYVDRFGNLVTNFRMERNKEAILKINDRIILLHNAYGKVNEGELVALTGSSGLVEIAVRNGHAQNFLNAGYGTQVLLKVK